MSYLHLFSSACCQLHALKFLASFFRFSLYLLFSHPVLCILRVIYSSCSCNKSFMHQIFVLFSSLFILNDAEYSLEVLPAHSKTVQLHHFWLLKAVESHWKGPGSAGAALRGAACPGWHKRESKSRAGPGLAKPSGYEQSDQSWGAWQLLPASTDAVTPPWDMQGPLKQHNREQRSLPSASEVFSRPLFLRGSRKSADSERFSSQEPPKYIL